MLKNTEIHRNNVYANGSSDRSEKSCLLSEVGRFCTPKALTRFSGFVILILISIILLQRRGFRCFKLWQRDRQNW